jgi:hypothetical protein
MMEIPLTQGIVALVDDEDYEALSQFKWHTERSGDRFYARRKITVGPGRQDNVRMHHSIMETTDQVDHENGNGLDNRRANLRLASQAQNQQNRGISKANSSGFKGVSWNKRKQRWIAYIHVGGKQHYLGAFSTPEQAALAYDRAAREKFGEFAHCNLPSTSIE